MLKGATAMNRFSEMGFTKDSWKGQRGEYWVLAQMALLAVFAVVPKFVPEVLMDLPMPVVYGIWGVAGAIALLALILLGKGMIDLGQNLTPLTLPPRRWPTGADRRLRHCSPQPLQQLNSGYFRPEFMVDEPYPPGRFYLPVSGS